MTKLKIKVCGMRDTQNILEVAAMHPDFMGFIFYERSKRFVGEDFQIPQELPEQIQRVGVFVNERVDRMLDLVKTHNLDVIQLHGDEPAEVCKALQGKVKLIKVFRVDEDFDFDQTKVFEGVADYFMFDTKTSEYGGSGRSFNWSLLKQYHRPTPFFLSGGVSAANVAQIVQLRHPGLFAVDINSGAEIAPGLKDIQKLHSIFTILNSSSHEIHR